MTSRKMLKRPAVSRTQVRAQSPYLSRDALRVLGGISEDQLTLWEFEEFISHAALIEIDGKREPVYSHTTLRRIKTIRSLAEELGVNLPGIGVILQLLDRLDER